MDRWFHCFKQFLNASFLISSGVAARCVMALEIVLLNKQVQFQPRKYRELRRSQTRWIGRGVSKVLVFVEDIKWQILKAVCGTLLSCHDAEVGARHFAATLFSPSFSLKMCSIELRDKPDKSSISGMSNRKQMKHQTVKCRKFVADDYFISVLSVPLTLILWMLFVKISLCG